MQNRPPDEKSTSSTCQLITRMYHPSLQFPVSQKTADDTWIPNPGLSALRGVMAGMAVPVAAMPFIQIEAKMSGEHKSLSTAVKETVKQPWKGYRFQALTNVPRCSLLFCGMPAAKAYLEKKQKMDPRAAKSTAALGVGIVEGVVMSARFPIMQILHTTNTPNITAAWKNMPPGEMMQRWRYSCRYGILRDGVFLPIYINVVDIMEEQLLVSKQKETPAKWEEEYMIGATGGLFASLFSFPVHAMLRRQLNNLNISQVKEMARVWVDEYSQKPFGAWHYMTRFVYKGYSAAALIMPITMGMTNLAKHAADVVYMHHQNKTGFFKLRSVQAKAVAPVPKDDVRFLMNMGTG